MDVHSITSSTSGRQSVRSSATVPDHVDGLLLDDKTVDDVISRVVNSVSESLSSELITKAADQTIEQKSDLRTRRIEKRKSEIEGLRRAINAAVQSG